MIEIRVGTITFHWKLQLFWNVYVTNVGSYGWGLVVGNSLDNFKIIIIINHKYQCYVV
jgi:hypothetical protein